MFSNLARHVPNNGGRLRFGVFVILFVALFVALVEPASAQDASDDFAPSDLGEETDPVLPVEPIAPLDTPGAPLQAPTAPIVDGPDDVSGTNVSTEDSALSIVVVLTALALVPTILIIATSFTRIVIVLGLTRNALGLQGVPPNQVLIGLAVFLTLFVMAPTMSEANDAALQPYLDGEIEFGEAYELGVEPFREFMLAQVREEDLSMFIDMSPDAAPATPEEVAITTLAPAFIVSELRAAFIIGFIIFIPFLVVDMIVSATLMAMGMVMLPPVVISLPFKILLFVMVDGWFLLVPTLLRSFEV